MDKISCQNNIRTLGRVISGLSYLNLYKVDELNMFISETCALPFY